MAINPLKIQVLKEINPINQAYLELSRRNASEQEINDLAQRILSFRHNNPDSQPVQTWTIGFMEEVSALKTSKLNTAVLNSLNAPVGAAAEMPLMAAAPAVEPMIVEGAKDGEVAPPEFLPNGVYGNGEQEIDDGGPAPQAPSAVERNKADSPEKKMNNDYAAIIASINNWTHALNHNQTPNIQEAINLIKTHELKYGLNDTGRSQYQRAIQHAKATLSGLEDLQWDFANQLDEKLYFLDIQDLAQKFDNPEIPKGNNFYNAALHHLGIYSNEVLSKRNKDIAIALIKNLDNKISKLSGRGLFRKKLNPREEETLNFLKRIKKRLNDRINLKPKIYHNGRNLSSLSDRMARMELHSGT